MEQVVHRGSPPAVGAGAVALRLSGTARRVFDGPSAAAADPRYRTYQADLARSYGLRLREEAFGAGQSYADMADAVLADVGLGDTALADRPADLVVLAFAVPDVEPTRNTACHLSYQRPGNPLAFTVCDSGTVAGFTGLRLIRAHAAGAGSLRALLVVVEQSAIPHELATGAAFPVAVPARHAAVALRFDQEGAGLLDAVRLRAGIAAPEAGALLSADLAELAAGHGDVTVLVGGGVTGSGLGEAVAAAAPAAEVIAAPEGQPSTGVWWEVAGRLQGWALPGSPAQGSPPRGRRVIAADYDPLRGSLCLAAIDFAASRQPASL